MQTIPIIFSWLRTTPLADQTDEFVQRFNGDEDSYTTDIERFILGGNFIPEEYHMTTWTADQSIDFLENRDEDRPFMLYSSFFGPHQPWDAPAPWKGTFDPDDIELPEFDPPSGGSPYFEARFPEKYRTDFFGNLKKADYKRIIAAYYDSITMIDHHIGRILDTLEQKGLWGEYHGCLHIGSWRSSRAVWVYFFKSSMYEGAARTPLLIKPAGGGPAGTTYEGNVNILDLYGTLGDAAGHLAWKSGNVEAGSLYSILQGSLQVSVEPVYSVLGATKLDSSWKPEAYEDS